MQHEHAEAIRDSPLSNRDLAPTTRDRRTEGPTTSRRSSAGYNWARARPRGRGRDPRAALLRPRRHDPGRHIADPGCFDRLYRHGVFVAFGISAVTHVALSAAARTEPSTAAVAE